jgi:hypothetical protein
MGNQQGKRPSEDDLEEPAAKAMTVEGQEGVPQRAVAPPKPSVHLSLHRPAPTSHIEQPRKHIASAPSQKEDACLQQHAAQSRTLDFAVLAAFQGKSLPPVVRVLAMR